jgi:hypothetical protein
LTWESVIVGKQVARLRHHRREHGRGQSAGGSIVTATVVGTQQGALIRQALQGAMREREIAQPQIQRPQHRFMGHSAERQNDPTGWLKRKIMP